MKITYTPNPLASKIELDEQDKKILRLNLQLEYVEDRVWRLVDNIGGMGDTTQVRKALDDFNIEYLFGETEAKDGLTRDQHLDRQVEGMVEECQKPHFGDCTSFAMSCLKCYVEDILGINTIVGLGKAGGSCINGAFYKLNEETEVTIDEALERLQSYQASEKTSVWDNYNEEQWKNLCDHWAQNRRDAHAWLLAYKTRHGF